MKKIIVTGAAGFIANNLARKLNANGFHNLILVDSFNNTEKNKNLEGVLFQEKIVREKFLEWLEENYHEAEFVFHLGARTDTSEFDFKILEELNLNYSKSLWKICTEKKIPLLYASSAATYGLGENGFSDEHSLVKNLKPLNPYGLSKQLFDLFALEQKQTPPFWCGLKFFNVFGAHENHKHRMASVVFHAYNQIKATDKVKLFKSHRADFKDGEQLRDFIYVDDVTDICFFFFKSWRAQKNISGIYNVGSGQVRTFNDLVNAVFAALHLPAQIEYIPTPEDIREKYQYFTEADIHKLRSVGYKKTFDSLEKNVEKYVKFLEKR